MFILQFLASIKTKTNTWKTIKEMKASVKCDVVEVLPVMDWFQIVVFEKIKGSIGQVCIVRSTKLFWIEQAKCCK